MKKARDGAAEAYKVEVVLDAALTGAEQQMRMLRDLLSPLTLDGAPATPMVQSILAAVKYHTRQAEESRERVQAAVRATAVERERLSEARTGGDRSLTCIKKSWPSCRCERASSGRRHE